MNRRTFLGAIMAATLPFPAFAAQCRDAKANASDVRWLIDQTEAHYAYLPDRHIDMAKLRSIYVGEAHAVCDPHAFLGVLEHLIAELHDHHIEANVNNAASPQLVPTGTEVWAAFHDSAAVIEAVRPGSPCARAGVRAGDIVAEIGDMPVDRAVATAMPRALRAPDPEANDYILRVLLAGTHNKQRDFTLKDKKRVVLPPFERQSPATLLSTARHGKVIVLRVENSLGESGLVAEMDKALDNLGDAKAIVLDLRDTPSGGNTDVAEPMLGRFIKGRPGYQRGFLPGPGRSFPKDGYTRWVRERGATVTLPMAVLCSRWTGSMGEGMTIGLDGMKRAVVVGTRMAGLCGATKQFVLPKSQIGVTFPVERLYHLDGTPREKWAPPHLVDLATAQGDDPILNMALELLG
jgi:carboxyl-terminal processing protease